MPPMRLAALVLALIAVFAIAWLGLPGRTTPIREGPAPVARLFSAPIGGMDQYLLIRGQDRANPVLLWLHGGPGAAQMPLAHATTAALEADFTVVHWDQRGAGRSNPFDFDETSMSIERFVSDAHEVTRLVQEMLEVEQLVLLGHSWGAMLGARLAARHPGDYAAFIGVGQPVNTSRGVELSLTWLQERGHFADAMPADFADHARYVELMQRVEAEGGGIGRPAGQLARLAFRAREYALMDYLRWLRGARRGSGPMWEEYHRQDLIADVPEMPVPLFLISGAQDMNTPARLSAEWLRMVAAPAGKRHIIFERSGHAPFLSEPERFAQTLRQIARELRPR